MARRSAAPVVQQQETKPNVWQNISLSTEKKESNWRLSTKPKIFSSCSSSSTSKARDNRVLGVEVVSTWNHNESYNSGSMCKVAVENKHRTLSAYLAWLETPFEPTPRDIGKLYSLFTSIALDMQKENFTFDLWLRNCPAAIKTSNAFRTELAAPTCNAGNVQSSLLMTANFTSTPYLFTVSSAAKSISRHNP